MHDPELTNRGLQLLGMKESILETLCWMIKHFDHERELMQWGHESEELVEAKKLKEEIESI